MERKDKRQINLKIGAMISLVFLLLYVIRQLIAVYQTRYQLVSPLIPESTIWEINKQFVFTALVAAIAGVIGLVFYFLGKYLPVIILVVLMFIINRFIYI